LASILTWPRKGASIAVPEGDADVLFVAASSALPPGAVQRLEACARHEPAVATVSTFADAGRLATYPRFAARNAEVDAETARVLDAHFAATNPGIAIDLPVAESGCLYITRAALRAAGEFADVATLSARCSAAGLRHLVCADVFVPRGDGFDSGELNAAQRDSVREFSAREPLRPLRRKVDLSRLRASPRPRWLMVSHAMGGGLARHVRDVARLVEGDCEVLCLEPGGPGVARLRWLREGEEFSAWLRTSRWADIVAMLRAIAIDRVHFHHVHGWPPEVLQLPAQLDAPYDVTLHDYFPACPRYHLNPPGDSCDGEGAACVRCLEEGPDAWGIGLSRWRETFGLWLQGAERAIVPSSDAAGRLHAFFPQRTFEVWAHPEAAFVVPGRVKVLLLGGVSAIKGSALLEACVRDAQARGLPLHFHVAGYVDRTFATFPEAPLTIGGSYDDASLGELLALERPDAFLFLSQVAETYSYTLSAAIATGKPIVATEVGAFPERLQDHPRAALLPRTAPAKAFNDEILRMVS